MTINTPTNKLRIGLVDVYVKREDLYQAPLPLYNVQDDPLLPFIYPVPPFAKMRGLVPYLEDLKDAGYQTIGYMDTAISMAGWGISWYARHLQLHPVIFYPQYKDGNRHYMAEHITECVRNGAEVLMLENPTQLSINWYRARKVLEDGWLKAHLLPQGLPFVETIMDVADEVASVPKAALTGSIVINVGSGTMAAGVITGLIKLGIQDLNVYGVMTSMGNPKKVKQKILRKVRAMRFGWRNYLTIIDAGYAYEDRAEVNVPFPCNAYYDKKAWKWLMENIKGIPHPVLFWNIGGSIDQVPPVAGVRPGEGACT